MPAPAGRAGEQEALGIHQDRRSGGGRRAPWCQGNAANPLAACPHVGTSRGVQAREGRASSRTGAGEPQLALAARQGGALPPQAHYRLRLHTDCNPPMMTLSEAKIPLQAYGRLRPGGSQQPSVAGGRTAQRPLVMQGASVEVIRRRSDGGWLYSIGHPYEGAALPEPIAIRSHAMKATRPTIKLSRRSFMQTLASGMYVIGFNWTSGISRSADMVRGERRSAWSER
jgi:hypothetical protein